MGNPALELKWCKVHENSQTSFKVFGRDRHMDASLDSSVVIATRLRAGWPRFSSRQYFGIFLLATASSPSLGSIQLCTQWVTIKFRLYPHIMAYNASTILTLFMQCILRNLSHVLNKYIWTLIIYMFTVNKQNGLKMLNWKEPNEE